MGLPSCALQAGTQPMVLTDGWPSGRRRTPGTRVGGQLSRGFESHPIRHYLTSRCRPSGFATVGASHWLGRLFALRTLRELFSLTVVGSLCSLTSARTASRPAASRSCEPCRGFSLTVVGSLCSLTSAGAASRPAASRPSEPCGFGTGPRVTHRRSRLTKQNGRHDRVAPPESVKLFVAADAGRPSNTL